MRITNSSTVGQMRYSGLDGGGENVVRSQQDMPASAGEIVKENIEAKCE